MSDAREFKSVKQRMPAPFEEMRIDVRPVSVYGKPGVVGHSVGVMDELAGRGTRSSLEFAEAKARAILKAVRAYRRANHALLETDPGAAAQVVADPSEEERRRVFESMRAVYDELERQDQLDRSSDGQG